jgi:hypothetical protein
MSDRLSIQNELKELNSPLSGQVPRMPYAVPTGYFETLAGQVLGRIRQEEVDDELASLAPGLLKTSRQTPYALPTDYFKSVQIPVTPSAPAVPLFRRTWFRYTSAVAAMLLGVTIWLNQDAPSGTTGSAGAAVVIQYKEDLQKLDEGQKDLLQEFVEAGMTGEETAQLEKSPALQASLLADISEEELTDFLEQSEPITSSTEMNN